MKKKLLFIFYIFLFVIPFSLVIFIYPKNIYKIKEGDYVISEELSWSIYDIELNNGILECTGWILLPGQEQGYAVLDNKSVWLKGEKTFYKLKSKSSSDRDATISNTINDGVDYQSAIFSSSVDISSLLGEETYLIYFCLQHDGQNLIVPTNYYIEKDRIYSFT